jgi:aldose 1-epimerase
VSYPPKLVWPDGDVTLEVSSSCDHWVVYTEPPHAVCVEPQSGPPDAFNLGRGFVVVEPGAPLVHTMTWRW